jgi:hypothetical protein
VLGRVLGWGGVRTEEIGAEALEQPEVGGVHVDSAPIDSSAVEYRPDQRQATAFAGQAADDLDPAARFAEGPLDQVGVVNAPPVFSRKPQMRGQMGQLVERGVDRARVTVGPALGELVSAAAGLIHRGSVRLGVDTVEIAQ